MFLGDSIEAGLTRYTNIWNDIIRGIFISIIFTIEYQNILQQRQIRYISSAPKNTPYTIPTNAKIDESVIKKIFSNVSISRETCHYLVSNYDEIKVFKFNLKTVSVLYFKRFIIIKSIWPTWNHNKRVMKCININQYQNKTRKATGFRSLQFNCWNISQVIQICKLPTRFGSTWTCYLIQSFLLKR